MSTHMTPLIRPSRTGRYLMNSAFGFLAILTLAATPLSVAHANSVQGSSYREGTISAHQTFTCRRAFEGGARAEVSVTTDVDAILKVYDQSNHLVVQKNLTVDMFSDDIPLVAWQPKKTQTFTIKIINPGRTPVQYGMRTN